MIVQLSLFWLLIYLLRKGLNHILVHESPITRSFKSLIQQSMDGFDFSVLQISYKFSVSYFLHQLKHEKNRYRIIFLNYWFSCGSICMLIGMIMSPYFLWCCLTNLISMAYDNISGHNNYGDGEVTAIITPIIPGLNFPGRYVFGFWICTLLVTCIHEIGHAVAAVRENLQIRNAGIFFIFALPGAYVEIDDSIQYLPMISQLRIYSAGIWHNIILCILCWTLLFICPILLNSTFYYRLNKGGKDGGGVIVLDYPSKYSVFHNILNPGDVIVSINNKVINNSHDLSQFIENISKARNISQYHRSTLEDLPMVDISLGGDERFNKTLMVNLNLENFTSTVNSTQSLKISPVKQIQNQSDIFYNLTSYSNIGDDGYCFVNGNHRNYSKVDDLECCSFAIFGRRKKSEMTCFLNFEKSVALTKLKSNIFQASEFQCLRARDVIQSDSVSCNSINDCPSLISDVGTEAQCLHPITEYPNHIMQIQLSSNKQIIVEGNPEYLFHPGFIGFGEIDVRFNFMKSQKGKAGYWFYVMLLNLPNNLMFYIKLILQLSASVAIINTLPIKTLDGSFCLPHFLEIISPEHGAKLADIIIKVYTIAIFMIVFISILPGVVKDIYFGLVPRL